MRCKIWVVLMLGIVSLPLNLGCFTENHQTRVSKGAQLTIVTGTTKIAQEIVFKHENEIRKITPNANKELVAVYLGIVNSDSARPGHATARPRAMPQHARAYPGLPAHVRAVPQHARACPCTPGHSRARPGTPGHARARPCM